MGNGLHIYGIRMKFLGTSTRETKIGEASTPQNTSCDGCQDPGLLTSALANTKKSFRHKKFNQVRISEVGTFCPREYALGFLTDTAAESFVDFPLQQVFDLGSALHYWMQNRSKVFRDCLCGYWSCLACQNYRLNADGSKYFGTKPKDNCETCGASPKATEYEEYMFRLTEPYRIVGKLDAVLLKDGVYRFADFKSYAKKDNFPLGKDVAQLAAYTYFYQFVPNEEKFPVPIDTSTAYLIYISKAFSYRESILTYPIRPTEKMIETIRGNVSQFTEATKTGNLPEPLNVCIRKDFNSGKAKDCSMRELCKEKHLSGL